MLLYWDPIQTAKMIYILRTQINALYEENIQLKNRPEPTPKPTTIIQISKQKHRIDLDKPIAAWNSSYFVKYFQRKYFEKYETRVVFKQDDWGAHALRINDFIRRHDKEITKEEYKQFINYLFKRVATRTFKLTVGTITSDTHFYRWFDTKKKRGMVEEEVDNSGIRPFTIDDVNNLIDRTGV